MRNAVMVGERVYLRPFEVSDAEAFGRSFTLETLTMMDRGRVPVSPIAFERGFDHPYKPEPPRFVDFAVSSRETDETIGSVALLEIDWVNRTAETASYLLSEGVRGQGYGTEAKMLLLEYAFDRLQLHLLYSVVWEVNERSAAALLKQGYRPAGRLKWSELRDGVYRDWLLFDLLRDDWLAARERWLKRQALGERQADVTAPGAAEQPS